MAFLAAASLSACGVPLRTDTPSPPLVGESSSPAGRSSCPGAVSDAKTDLQGEAATALENLQQTYEKEPGFLGVVFDGQKPVIVVERPQLGAWQLRTQPLGIAVAPSCVDPTLLVAVRTVVAATKARSGTILSAGYDAIQDAIFVTGLTEADLLQGLRAISPEAQSAGQVAIGNGTLRVAP